MSSGRTMKALVKESHNVTLPCGVDSLSFICFKNTVNLYRLTFWPENLDPIQLSYDYYWGTHYDLRSGNDNFPAFMDDLPLLIVPIMPSPPF